MTTTKVPFISRTQKNSKISYQVPLRKSHKLVDIKIRYSLLCMVPTSRQHVLHWQICATTKNTFQQAYTLCHLVSSWHIHLHFHCHSLFPVITCLLSLCSNVYCSYPYTMVATVPSLVFSFDPWSIYDVIIYMRDCLPTFQWTCEMIGYVLHLHHQWKNLGVTKVRPHFASIRTVYHAIFMDDYTFLIHCP